MVFCKSEDGMIERIHGPLSPDGDLERGWTAVEKVIAGLRDGLRRRPCGL
jgi:hypothetical protein